MGMYARVWDGVGGLGRWGWCSVFGVLAGGRVGDVLVFSLGYGGGKGKGEG